MSDEELILTGVRLPKSDKARMDRRNKISGVPTSEYLRRLIHRDLNTYFRNLKRSERDSADAPEQA